MKKTLYIIIALILTLLVVVGCYPADDPAYVAGNVTATLIDGSEVLLSDDAEVIFKGRTGDSTYQVPYLDPTTHILKTIDITHEKVHEGMAFSCFYEQEVSDIGDMTIIAFRTGPAKYIHLSAVTAFASTAAHAYILEAPKVDDNAGNSLTVFNRHRELLTASTVIDTSTDPDTIGQATYFTEVTSANVTGGTELTHAHLQAGDKKTLGGSSGDNQEWILAAQTLYAVVIESVTAEDNIHGIKLHWYELTNLAP